MGHIIEFIGIALVCTGAGFLILLQFLPARLTVTSGTEASAGVYKRVVWQLPKHMLSKFGNMLRMGCFTTVPIGMVIYLVAKLGQ